MVAQRFFGLGLGRCGALALMSALWLVACSADSRYGDADGWSPAPNANNSVNNTNNVPFIPEQERDYEFSAPAIYGQQLYIANETLNTLAVIDSESLAIKTLPVGFRPTQVVGPTQADAAGGRIIALNQGSFSVTIIDPSASTSVDRPVMPGANSLIASPNGQVAVAWYDRDKAADGQRAGDLSSISVIKDDQVYAVAVGFNIQRVLFSEDNARLIVLSDDGVSVIELATLEGDSFAPPQSTLPASLTVLDPKDLEVLIDARGRYVVTRTVSLKGFVLFDLEQKRYHQVNLPEIPTDIDLVEGAQLELLVMLRQQRQLVRATIPEGVINAAAATAPMPMMALNAPDMTLDMHPTDMAFDIGQGDMESPPPIDMGGASNAGDMDMGAPTPWADMDMTNPLDRDQSGDVQDMSVEDMAPASPLWPITAQGVSLLSFPDRAYGAASVSEDGAVSLLYTTTGAQRSVMLYHLASGATEEIFVEKRVVGVRADERGQTFILFHDKEPLEPGQPVPGSPADPGYVANSWGVSVVNVAAASARLILTQLEPAQAALWVHEQTAPLVYIIFAQPTDPRLITAAHRDVLVMNLETFRIDSFTVPSSPTSVGAIPGALKVYINQRHPQGRITFADVLSLKRQTITGYQLNAGID